MSGSTRSSPAIVLEGLDSMINVKKETKTVAPKPASSPANRTRSSASKKRKTTEPASPFEGLSGVELQSKLMSLLTQDLSKAKETIADLKKIAAAKEEYYQAKAKEAEKLQKEMEIMRAEHDDELAAYKAGVTKSAAQAILKAMIQMATDASEPDSDRASWDLEA